MVVSPPNFALKEQVDQLNNYAGQHVRVDTPEALTKAKQAEELARDERFGEDGYLEGITLSLVLQSLCHSFLSNFAKGLELGHSAEVLAEELDIPHLIAESHKALGRAYGRIGNYPKGQSHFHKQLKIAEEISDYKLQAEAHLGLSYIYGESEEHQSCADHAELALVVLQKLDMTQPHAQFLRGGCYNNLCKTYEMMGDLEKSLEYGLKGIELTKNDTKKRFGSLPSNVAVVYKRLGNYEASFDYLNRALQEAEKTPNKYVRANINTELAIAHFEINQLDDAFQYGTKALNLAKEAHNPWIQFKAHELLSKIGHKRGDFEAAFFHHQKFYEIKQSAIDEENRVKLQQMEINYRVEVAQKEAELYRTRNKELAILVDEKTTDLQNALSRERKLKAEILATLEQSNTANQVRSGIIKTISHEFRTPLTVIQSLTDLLARVKNLPDEKRMRIQGRINSSVDSLAELLRDVELVEQISDKTVTPVYQSIPFNQFCETAVSKFPIHSTLSVDYDSHDQGLISTDPTLVDDVLTILVANAIQYGNGQPICVGFSRSSDELKIEIADQGHGISSDETDLIFELFYRGKNTENLSSGLGIGLYKAQLLVAILNGTLSAESAPNQGTTFTLTLPATTPQPPPS